MEVPGWPEASPDTDLGGPPRVVIIAATVFAVMAIRVVLVIAATRQTPSQPVSFPTSRHRSRRSACRALAAALRSGS